MRKIPVYLILGFLESGKTNFIKDTLLQDYFMDGSDTLILACEEGEEEYEPSMLKRSRSKLVTIDSPEEFTAEHLLELGDKEDPDRIFIEYNGMWSVAELSRVMSQLPWEVAQVIMIAQGDGFDLYLNNMRSLAVEMFKVSELVIFNRCRKGTPRSAYRRVVRAANPRAQVAFEMADGEEADEEEDLPYDLKAEVLEIEDEDYGIFHMDAMEKPERYNGKKVHFRAMVCKPRWGTKEVFIPGRFAMVCCAEDVQFIGYIAKADPLMIKPYKNRDWVWVTARIGYERRKEYQGAGPVYTALKVEPAEPPAESMIYF